MTMAIFLKSKLEKPPNSYLNQQILIISLRPTSILIKQFSKLTAEIKKKS